MKNLVFTILLTTSLYAHAETSSVYTDLKADCIVVSSPTEEAPIDFYTTECKSFGGYVLKESGSDLRYGPELSYNGEKINLQRPASFHQMDSGKVEWVYDLERSVEGVGTLTFKALIYRIAEDTETGSSSNLFVVRLKGAKSCVIGKVKSNEQARKLANNLKAACIKIREY